MILADLHVLGRARTKGSLHVYCLRNRQHTVRLEEEVEQSKTWRARVARVCREYQLAELGGFRQYAGPVEVRAAFFLPREQARGGNTPLPSHATAWPTAISLGDADKLLRNVGDALLMPQRREDVEMTSGLILDDSQITRWSGMKMWCLGAYDTPRARILVTNAPDPAEALVREQEAWMRMGTVL